MTSRHAKVILFVNAFSNLERSGGTEHTLHSLLGGLAELGHRCVLLSLDGQSRKHSFANGDVITRTINATHGRRSASVGTTGGKRTFLNRQTDYALTTFNPFIQKQLRNIIDEEDPDIVSFHNLTHWSAASWKTAADSGRPVVQVLHDHFSLCFTSTMRNKGRNCEKQCLHCRIRRCTTAPFSKYLSAVVGVSDYILHRHLNLGRFNHVPIKRVIHDARPAQSLRAELPMLPATNRTFRFGYIGRIEEGKGIDVLLTAFARSNLSTVELWIAGIGDASYVNALRNRHIDGRIRWLGYVPQGEFYPYIDVLVVPSLWHEALGNVVFEAFAFGKPVLGANRGGIPELIKEGVNGILFDPDDIASLARAMQLLSTNDDLRARMSEHALESAVYFLDMRRWTDQYEDVYESVLRTSFHEFRRQRE